MGEIEKQMSVLYRMGAARQNKYVPNRGPYNDYVVSVSALRPWGNPSDESVR